MRNSRMARMAVLLLPVALLGSASQPELAPEELIRRGNAALAAGDRDGADRFYAAAEERTADPGLVAFNRATVLFQQELYREAELHYARVLDDTACPPERAAKAWYNRGTCLVRRDGATTAMLRSAIACLERCLDSTAADAPLRADARHNLELAKLLWNEARRKEKKPDAPSENPPPEDPRSDPHRPTGIDTQPGNPEPKDGQTGTRPPKPGSVPTGGNGDQRNPEQGHVPGPPGHVLPLADDPGAKPLDPDEARRHLLRISERLKRDQQLLRLSLYGPERPGLHDW